MPADPALYAAAIPAVVLTGLSKGGFGGTLSLLALPLLALVMSPLQAAGVMLPILLVMDAVAVISWRRHVDRLNYRMMMPGAVIGTIIGWATATIISDGAIRLIVGCLGLAFTANWLAGHLRPMAAARKPDWARATFWSSLSGFTSFISNAGGPPAQMYMLPQNLDKRHFAGTLTMFFATINVLKIVPFMLLGQISPDNLKISAVLFPFALASTLAGSWLIKFIPTGLFFTIVYSALTLTSLKLVVDGVAQLL